MSQQAANIVLGLQANANSQRVTLVLTSNRYSRHRTRLSQSGFCVGLVGRPAAIRICLQWPATLSTVAAERLNGPQKAVVAAHKSHVLPRITARRKCEMAANAPLLISRINARFKGSRTFADLKFALWHGTCDNNFQIQRAMRRPIKYFQGKESTQMKTQISTAIAMLVTVTGMLTSAQAQIQSQIQVQPQVMPIQTAQPPQVESYVVPGYQPPVAPPQQNEFYFGMNLQLNNGYQGTTLRIVSVTPGSPAAAAGLEIGDEIRTVNGRSFERARDSFHAVSMMNRFVSRSSGPAPAAAAASAGASAQAYVMPQPAPQPTAQLLVRNVRNGQNVWINIFPQRRGWSGPAPAAAASAAPVYTAPAPPAPPAYTAPAPPAYTPPVPAYSNP